jgi:hypothetical protein
MSDRHDPLDLPILDELGDDLARAFRAAEHTAAGAAAESTTPMAPDGGPERHAPRRPGVLRRRGRRWATGAVAATLTVGAVIVALPWGGDGQLGPAEATAAAVLRRAAGAAGRLPTNVPPRADQYAYTDELMLTSVTDVTGVGARAIARTSFLLGRRRTWSSTGHASVAVERTLRETLPGAPPPDLTLSPRELDAADDDIPPAPQRLPGRRASEEETRVPLGRAVYRLGDETLSAAALRSYPTDASSILRRLRASTAGQGRSPNGALWVAITDALRSVPVPAPLAAGLYRALAILPGVTLNGETVDRLGRRALRLSYQEPGTWERQILLIAADTYRRLGDQTVVAARVGVPARGVPPTRTTVDGASVPAGDDTRPPFPPGTVTSESLIVRAGVTDRVGGPLVDH